MSHQTTRREAVLAAGVVGLAGSSLAGCSASGSDPATSGSTAAGPVTVKAADVPVGGGTILAAANVVVTQPTAGTFKAFSATCTHQGCLVSAVANGQISCPCHGSTFSITDGAVTQGPATSPLPAKTVTDSSGTLTVA